MKTIKMLYENSIISKFPLEIAVLSFLLFLFLIPSIHSQENSTIWRIVDVAPVSTDIALKVVKSSTGIYHLAWQENDKIKYSRSTDNGLTWSIPQILRTGITKWMGMYLDNEDVLHVGYVIDGIFPNGPYYIYHFYSLDNGNTWSQNHTIQNVSYWKYLGGHAGMCVSSDGKVFVGGHKPYDNHFYNKISFDKGVTWSELRSTSFPLADTYGGRAIDFLFDSNNNIHVLVWTWHDTWGGNERVWYIKSTDLGATWTLPTFICNFNRSALPHILQDPDDPNILYIFAGNESKKSIDNGNSWIAWNGIPEGLPLIDRSTGTFYIRYISNGTYYYRISENKGTSWSSGIMVGNPGTVESIGFYGQVNGFFPYFYGKSDDGMAFFPFWIDSEPSGYYIRCGIQGTPPVANAGPDQTVEATSAEGAEVTLDGSSSSDPDGDPLTYHWYEDGILIAEGIQPTIQLSLGEHHISLIVNDGQFDSEPDEVVISVVDTTPPNIQATANPDMLWPPNHRMVPVHFDLSVSDIVDPNPEIILESVSSNEPDDANGNGDGNTVNDIQDANVGTEDYDILLRAERAAQGNGRIYTIVYSATDFSGNAAYDTVEVYVPKSMGKMAVSMESIDEMPKEFRLYGNYPNPFNPTTTIRYALPEKAAVSLRVLNLRGQLVKMLVQTTQAAGIHQVVWDARDEQGRLVPSGMYLLELRSGTNLKVHKMLLAR